MKKRIFHFPLYAFLQVYIFQANFVLTDSSCNFPFNSVHTKLVIAMVVLPDMRILAHVRMGSPIRVYSYGTPIRIWDNSLSHIYYYFILMSLQVFGYCCYTLLKVIADAAGGICDGVTKCHTNSNRNCQI